MSSAKGYFWLKNILFLCTNCISTNTSSRCWTGYCLHWHNQQCMRHNIYPTAQGLEMKLFSRIASWLKSFLEHFFSLVVTYLLSVSDVVDPEYHMSRSNTGSLLRSLKHMPLESIGDIRLSNVIGSMRFKASSSLCLSFIISWWNSTLVMLPFLLLYS